MPFPPEIVGIIAKPHADARPYIQKALAVCADLGIDVCLGDEAAQVLNRKDGIPREQVVAGSGLVVVIGGDGTFLSVAPAAVVHAVPIAGFNLGTLGFLTELAVRRLEDTLRILLTGGLPVSERKVLRVRVGKQEFLALNDVVVSKGNIARIIQLELRVNHSAIAHIRADGLILSTPTGSTAYSLSAGGPIVNPEVNALVITPICAHSLTLRPLVIPDALNVSISRDHGENEVFVTVDGQHMIPLEPGGSVYAGVDDRRLRMIESPDMDYFRLLAEKLNWGFQKCAGPHG